MRPLISTGGGNEIGVHESAVSRVANTKRLTSSAGVSEWRFFFFCAMVTADGSA